MDCIRLLVLIACTTACTFSRNPPDDSPPGNDGGASCFGTGGFTICIPDGVTVPGTFDLGSDGIINTGAPNACTFFVEPDDQPRLCVKAARSITISKKLQLFGPDPFVLLATETFELAAEATIDAASHQGLVETGPGADALACVAGTPGSPDADGGGGGAGGSFNGLGANGGTGKTIAGGTAGAATGAPEFLRGGCRASNGGDGGPATLGNGGHGGGAIYLLSGGSMVLAGVVNASGAGGDQGLPPKGGAGGGGSGGLIVIYARRLEATGARLFANGGGGGEAGDNGNDGDPGDDPAAFDVVALGGLDGNGGAGSEGGNGAFLVTPAENGDNGGDGGGGGGGGVGFVLVVSQQPLDGASVSPL